MSEWFGKGCDYLRALWADWEEYQDLEPVMKYCRHPDSEDDSDKGCNRQNCPMKKKRTRGSGKNIET